MLVYGDTNGTEEIKSLKRLKWQIIYKNSESKFEILNSDHLNFHSSVIILSYTCKLNDPLQKVMFKALEIGMYRVHFPPNLYIQYKIWLQSPLFGSFRRCLK